jgi:hypothetical protein
LAGLSEEARNHAQAEQGQWEDVTDAVEGVGGGLIVGGVIFPPAVVPAAVVGFGLGLLHIYAGRKGRSAGRKAHDPPRDDYSTAIELQEPEPFIALGDSPFGRAMTDLLKSLARTVILEEAMVLADERALGAGLAGDMRMKAEREEEALRFGLLGSELNRDIRSRADALAAVFDDLSLAEARAATAGLATALRAAGRASEVYGAQFLMGRAAAAS